MATTNRVYIVAAFLFSAIAAILNIVSLSTEEWINGKAVWPDSSTDINYINYGLFQGNYRRNIAFISNFQLTMTCSFKNNVCALLCGLDAEARGTLLDNLYNNVVSSNYSYDNCPSLTTLTHIYRSFEERPIRAPTGTVISSDSFINAGVWLCTLIFLILAMVVGFAASILALYNTVTNPVQYFLSVRSLYVYNGAAFSCTLLYMILWGTMYNLIIFHNVCIYDTIVGNISSDKTAYLGYSYWVNFIPLAFYAGSMAILYYREYLNERDPKQKKVTLEADSSDPTLYLY